MKYDSHNYYRKFLAGNYTASDYYYGPKGSQGPCGPWPQPSPDLPFGQYAEVLHIPKEELKEWKWKVALHYVWLLITQWPVALWYVLRHPHLKHIDDEHYVRFFTNTLYSKYLVHIPKKDFETYKDIFPDLTPKEDSEYYVADFSIMDMISPHTYPGMYAASTIALLCRDSGTKKMNAVAIHLCEQKLTLSPSDTDAWALSKYFVLQGAVHRINLVTHAILHFPFDPINAISKTLLPKKHFLFKLLFPHLYLELPVNNSVLEGAGSLINRTKWTLYAPFVAKGKYIRQLLPVGYVGQPSPHEPQPFPPYQFPLIPEFIDRQNGELKLKTEYEWLPMYKFLFHYYKTIRSFVDKVIHYWLKHLLPPGNPDLYYVNLWAEQIAQWVPGFPDGSRIFEPNHQDHSVLVDTVALIIWNLAVAHPTDHAQIHRIETDELPFRLRVPPPSSKDWLGFDLHKLNKRRDFFKSWLTDRLFYEPYNLTWLKDVDYHFEDEHLQGLNAQFLHELRATEDEVKKYDIANLEDLACSIQY